MKTPTTTCDVRVMLLDDHIDPPGAGCLTPAERRRLARFRQAAARRQFLWARHVARTLVAERLGLEPSVVQLHQRCPSCGSDEHGLPGPVEATHMSWAHTARAVAAAADAGPVGVDVESMSQFFCAPSGMVELLCTPAEAAMLPTDATGRARALVRLWTVKEALAKVGATNLDSMRKSHVGVVDESERSTFRDWDLTTAKMGGLMIAVASRAADRHLAVQATRHPRP